MCRLSLYGYRYPVTRAILFPVTWWILLHKGGGQPIRKGRVKSRVEGGSRKEHWFKDGQNCHTDRPHDSRI